MVKKLEFRVGSLPWAMAKWIQKNNFYAIKFIQMHSCYIP
jgi:hypothetical protein